jgi:hypothetical protein
MTMVQITRQGHIVKKVGLGTNAPSWNRMGGLFGKKKTFDELTDETSKHRSRCTRTHEKVEKAIRFLPILPLGNNKIRLGIITYRSSLC